MAGLGTIVNVVAVVAGGGAGLLLKHGLKDRFQQILLQALGLSVLFVGITGGLRGLLTVNGTVLETQNTLLMIASLVIGAFLANGGVWKTA